MKVLVACPTRDRVPSAIKLCQSVLRTSKADVVFYTDDDQRQYYEDQFDHHGTDRYTRVRFVSGNRVGPVRAANDIAKTFDWDLFGYVPDDCEFKVNGWDDYALSLIGDPRTEIAVINAPHPFGDHIDIPFVTRAWMEVIGEFAPASLGQWCWNTIIAILAEVGDIAVSCDRDRFYIDHVMELSELAGERQLPDSVAFYMWCVHEFPPMLAKLRKAVEEQRCIKN